MPGPPTAAVLIFTRGPAGEAARKRLRPCGGADPLGTAFETILEQVRGCEAEVIIAAPDRAPIPDLPFAAGRIPQQGSGSADRLRRAMAEAFSRGVERLVVIGDDAPGIRSDDLESALGAIAAPEPTAVVGPCRDGGFYLLALNRPVPEILRGIPWGSRRTLSALRRRLQEGGFEVRTLRPLADIDDRAGLERLNARHDTAGLRELRAQIAVWVRAACAWAATVAGPLRDEPCVRLLPPRAPPLAAVSS